MRSIAMDIRAILAASAAVMALAPVTAVLAADEKVQLEEIVVMAQKRAESLQVVPIAATAVTGEALEVRFAKDFTDISGAIPNTTLELEGISNYSAAFFIRGQGVLNRGPFIDPAVGVITDGVADGRVNTAMQDFLDIEAVETLRGPQGTLQGRNATAGAILVRHNKPNVDEFEGNVGGTLGNYGRHDVKGMINMPFAQGSAAFRMAAKYSEFDGYYRNAYNGKNNRIGGQKRWSLLPSIRFKGDNLDVTLRGDVAHYNDDAAVLVPLYHCGLDPRIPANIAAPNPAQIDTFLRGFALNAAGNPNAGPDAAYRACAKPAKRSQYTVNQDRSVVNNGAEAALKVWGLTSEANYEVAGAGTLTYVGGYRENHETSDLDTDAGPLKLFWNTEDTKHWQTSHELRFATDFSKTIDIVAGALWFKQKYTLDRLSNDVNNTLSSQTNEQWGAFAHVRWHFNDALTAVLGGRYSHDKKDFRICSINAVPCDGLWASGPFVGTPRTQTDGKSWSDFSPRVGLDYQLNDDVFLYTYWARGFRAGGFNGEAANIVAAGPYDPEKNNTFEGGFKADLLDKRLRVNAAVFYVKVDNLQRNISRVSPLTTQVEIVTQNAADAKFKGAELEITALVSDSFTFNLSTGYLDAKYKNFCVDINGTAPNDPSLQNCGPAVVTPLGTIQPADESFLPLARAPKWTVRANPTYKFDTGFGSVLVSAEWVYNSRLFTNDQGAPNGLDTGLGNFDGTRIDPYRKATNVVNASITWRDPDNKYKVSLYGKNLTREIYYRRLSFAAPTLSFGTMNDPREYGIEASYSF